MHESSRYNSARILDATKISLHVDNALGCRLNVLIETAKVPSPYSFVASGSLEKSVYTRKPHYALVVLKLKTVSVSSAPSPR